MPKDLHELPKFRAGLSYIYLEHAKIEQDGKSIGCYDKEGKLTIPCATLGLLMLGPGTSITHEAVKTLADNGCLVMWCGEEGVRFYAHGYGETRKARKIILQAALASDSKKRMEVVKRMYKIRFRETNIDKNITLQELRGMEGVRVRGAYVKASRETNIPWSGRNYDRSSWSSSDAVNRALSCANSCLYGICHAAIVSAGYSPALGFIHTGKQLSFVYDIADLYKADITIPTAFKAVTQGAENLEKRVRISLRDRFREMNLL